MDPQIEFTDNFLDDEPFLEDEGIELHFRTQLLVFFKSFILVFLGIAFLMCICIVFCSQIKEDFNRNESVWQSSARDLNRSLWPNKVHLACSYWADSGLRTYMEDRYSINGELKGESDSSFFGVYDGHGGAVAAQFVADNLCKIILNTAKYAESKVEAVRSAFMEVDSQFEELCQQEGVNDGTTAVAALVNGNKIIVGNVGDSRAVLVQKGAKPVPLSHDHKPSRQDEHERITSLGGKVIHWGRWRVEGVLAVSRAIGDRNLKPYVTPEPEIIEWDVGEDDLYLVLASDGIWDVMSNLQVARFIIGAQDFKWVAKELCDEAFTHGSTDNVCAIVVDLKNGNKSQNNLNPGSRNQEKTN
mmetsp:Transcript_3409/g.4437  ORF Transcript_3409/g.4437 Transcript_3409/m.4437 type:complete len:358 (+) Transcript_3409:196-1269(+)